jgi:DNA ligase-1
MIREIANGLNNIKETSGKNDKVTLLRQFCETSSVHDTVMRFILDDRITTGLDLKKIRNDKVGILEDARDYDLVRLLNYFIKNNTGRHEDVAVAKGFLSGLDEDLVSTYEQILTRTLNLGVGVKGYNEAFPDNQIFLLEVMKGVLYESEKFNKIRKKYGKRFAISSKIDGNRSTYFRDDLTGEFQFISPNGKIHQGYDHIMKEVKEVFGDKYFIDGEFEYYDESGQMTNDEIRQKTSSICSSKAKEKLEIRYKIFSILPLEEWESGIMVTKYFDMRETFMTYFDKCIEEKGCKYISILPLLYEGTDEDMIMKIFKQQREEHKEGVIINFDCPYICGKRDGLMKVKDILDLDLKVVGYKLGKENTRLEKALGALEVELEVDGKIYIVDVGSGLTDEFRFEFMESPEQYIGKVVEVLATEVSKNKDGGYSLSYPRFVEFRDKSVDDVDRIECVGKGFKIIN